MNKKGLHSSNLDKNLWWSKLPWNSKNKSNSKWLAINNSLYVTTCIPL